MNKSDFANISNAAYVEELYRRYLADPASVTDPWRYFFAGYELAREEADRDAEAAAEGETPQSAANGKGPAHRAQPAVARPTTGDAAESGGPASARASASASATTSASASAVAGRPSSVAPEPPIPAQAARADSVPDAAYARAVAPAAADPERRVNAARTSGAHDLVHSFRELGHLIANLDPLGKNETSHPLLDFAQFNFTVEDLDKAVDGSSFLGSEPTTTLRSLVAGLKQTYCRSLGVEYMYISNKEHREWLQSRIEPTGNVPELDTAGRRKLLHLLNRANIFERFIQTKYVGQKRFSLEGGEALVPLVQTLIEESADLGVHEIVMGMPHRGRLNVLAHNLAKPYGMIFSEFEGSFLPDGIQGDGDVKYHLGYSHDHKSERGSDVHLSLLFNPSHLEVINPVAVGIAAGKQHYRNDRDGSRVMPILMHGDAAFMGQGLVMETLALSELPSYTTGGTIHIIVNNQIGFTTGPENYRFTRYPTEAAKIVQAPVLHVNADDPEAAVQAARLAAAFRARFKEDVFIDLVCYRRRGHNEADDPTFTQPVMYKTISGKRPVNELYRDRLVENGTITAEEAEADEQAIRDQLDRALNYARDFMPKQQVFTFGGAWKGLMYAGESWDADTKLSRNALERVLASATQAPAGFAVHKTVKKLYEQRAAMFDGEGEIDWGCAEMLALGTLLLEGHGVRLAGQDSGRGTFGHRHAALYDSRTGERYVPLDQMADDQGRFWVIDSNLSEAGVLGFEYGFSSADPHNLVIWEAQFGDFNNMAQMIIDQFIVSAESKWQRMSGLVMLLPHGYEGQGPEHSSARPERFLTMCAEQNIQVCVPTTPAQLFHVLRRQLHRSFRKPLIIMSPKSMLRHKLCVSKTADLTDGTFETVISEQEAIKPEQTRRLIFCSGKVYYDLVVARADRSCDDVAIVRIEQLYPFPLERVRAEIEKYPVGTECYWVQEEPKNMGAWRFVSDRDQMIFGDDTRLTFVGRDSAASPATGSYKVHQRELQQLIDEALRPPKQQRVRKPNGR